jgi:hypothetical protein
MTASYLSTVYNNLLELLQNRFKRFPCEDEEKKQEGKIYQESGFNNVFGISFYIFQT